MYNSDLILNDTAKREKNLPILEIVIIRDIKVIAGLPKSRLKKCLKLKVMSNCIVKNAIEIINTGTPVLFEMEDGGILYMQNAKQSRRSENSFINAVFQKFSASGEKEAGVNYEWGSMYVRFSQKDSDLINAAGKRLYMPVPGIWDFTRKKIVGECIRLDNSTTSREDYYYLFPVSK